MIKEGILTITIVIMRHIMYIAGLNCNGNNGFC